MPPGGDEVAAKAGLFPLRVKGGWKENGQRRGHSRPSFAHQQEQGDLGTFLDEFGLHFDLTPRECRSGETDVTGRISKIGGAGAPIMRYEGISTILPHPARGSALKSWQDKSPPGCRQEGEWTLGHTNFGISIIYGRQP
jgi:hypothetical protein